MRKDAEFLHELRVHKVKVRSLKKYDDAIKAGEAYYQGKPCLHGHPGHRYTSNKQCISCKAMAQSRHRYKKYEKNQKPSKMLEIDRLKDANDPDYWDDL